MQQYRHTMVEVEGNNAGAALVEVAAKKQLDVLVVGVREKLAIRRTLGNTTDYIVHHATCPCLVIRPKTAVGDMHRLRSRVSGDVTPREISRLSNEEEVRRVAIAFDTLQTGQMLFKWAVKKFLNRTDLIIVVRSCPQKLFKKARLCNKFDELSNDEDQLFGDELQGFNVIQEIELKGDPRSTLTSFVHSENIDLLILARSSLHPLFKGLGGKNVSKALYHRSSCPCMVVPLRSNRQIQQIVQTRSEEEPIISVEYDQMNPIMMESVQVTSDESGDEVIVREEVLMVDQSCQTDNVECNLQEFENDGEGPQMSASNQLPTQKAVQVHRTIESLNEKLRQKDALISELRRQLKDMQHKISFIMDEVASSGQGSSGV
eukprot:TRINITY_DN3941_c0_g1_i6.p1 TRINITY_DN3941_c0_g1~~TRINITY_DN3941_c0_g1_i6.p1  ORF type:complete len:375 (-),score=49.40 TRINITY_DN3941_c0_g1_i6:984-2108(-)